MRVRVCLCVCLVSPFLKTNQRLGFVYPLPKFFHRNEDAAKARETAVRVEQEKKRLAAEAKAEA